RQRQWSRRRLLRRPRSRKRSPRPTSPSSSPPPRRSRRPKSLHPRSPPPRPRLPPKSPRSSLARPIAVAITGGIGAGKSEAPAAFARHGAAVISSDEIVHRLLSEDDDVRAQLVERFGNEVIDDEGRVDR